MTDSDTLQTIEQIALFIGVSSRKTAIRRLRQWGVHTWKEGLWVCASKKEIIEKRQAARDKSRSERAQL